MQIMDNQDICYLDDILLDQNRQLKIVHSSIYQSIPQEHLALFGHKYGYYLFPTLELAEWLKNQVDLTSTIEIGAGHGALARYLGIPATDSRYMERDDIKQYYAALNQPVTQYPDDIEKLDAIEAIDKYKPECVIGCWITHKYKESEHWRGGNMFGVDENRVIRNVSKYIMIGNEQIHNKKKILELSHKDFKFPWIFSRSMNVTGNIIYVWEK
jgi:hypothetical protein